MSWGKFIGTVGLFGAYIHAIRNGTILAIDPTLPSQSLILEKMNAFSIFCFSPLQKLNQLDIY